MQKLAGAQLFVVNISRRDLKWQIYRQQQSALRFREAGSEGVATLLFCLADLRWLTDAEACL